MDRYIKWFIVILLAYLPVSLLAKRVEIVNLLVEYEQNPMGIDVQCPRFSWQMKTDKTLHGYVQTAYQITVTDKTGHLFWDSGKVSNSESLNIIYHGKQLFPSSRYDWTVKVWDQNDVMHQETSWFETGLMCNNDKDVAWGGAQWIGVGDKDKVLYSHYLPAFRIDCTVTFDKQSRSSIASVVYGGNDERLMNSNKNVYHLQARRDSSFIQIELDASKVLTRGPAVLNIYRQGYCPDDKNGVPIRTFMIPETVIRKENLYKGHQISVASNLGDTDLYVDGEKIGTLNLNPLGRGGDFTAFPVVGDVGLLLKAGQVASITDFMIRNYRSPSGLIATVGQLGREKGDIGRSLLQMINPTRNAMPMLRSEFDLGKEISEARLYVTARGIYDFYVNGQRIGEDYLNPGITQYNKTHLYQIYDVTRNLQFGKNVIGAILGEGWWSGGATYEGQNWNYFGDCLSLLAKLSIVYADGSRQEIVSNPADWKYCVDGPVRYGSLFQGEVYDARKDILGWATIDYDASKWKQVAVIGVENHVSLDGWGNGTAPGDYSHYRLMPHFGQFVRRNQRLQAKSVSEIRPGVFVYDMGQNMVGVPNITMTGLSPGTSLSIRYAEMLYPDLPEYQEDKGMLMLENIRAAMAQDRYIARGGTERFSPRFTVHGYRYLEITGLDKALPLEQVCGNVLSSIYELVSCYTTSNPLVNKLWQNITWSTLGNFVSIPTDCPQRNERLGWAGDISVYSRTAVYMAFLPQFLRRYLLAMRDVQREDGRMPDIAPLGGGFGGLLWGSASIVVAWECYQQYGDKMLLEEHYDAIKKYVDYIYRNLIDDNTNIIVQDRSWGDLGDWLGLEDDKNDKSLFWEAYLIYDLDLMRRIAETLGKKEDAMYYAEKRKERKDFFVHTYLRPVDWKTIASGFGTLSKGSLIDTQTSYVLPLALGIVEGDTAKVIARNLRQTIERRGIMDNGKSCPPYSLLTGFIGTSWISKALSDAGMSDVAYRLLQQKDYPSWIYPVTQGATTVWERLNSYTHMDGFGGNNRMNSFNHYSFGAVGAWMYNYSLGIERDENSPGFKHFILRPIVDPTGEMNFAQGYYDSMYGRIESSWKVDEDGVDYHFSIPANTSATLYLYDRSSPNEEREIMLESGEYDFRVAVSDKKM